VAPATEFDERFFEVVACAGEFVFDPDGRGREDAAFDEARDFEFAEALGKEGVGKIGDGEEDFVEALGAGEEDDKDEAHPTLAKEVEGVGGGRTHGDCVF